MLRIDIHRLVCYGGHLESKMATKIQKSSDLGEIWFPSRLWCCELISIIWEPLMSLQIISLHHPECCRVMHCYSTFLFHHSFYSYYSSSTHFCPLDFSEMPWSNFMKPCRNIICHVKLCFQGLIFSEWLPLPWKWPKC
jgi:hypothetical protein